MSHEHGRGYCQEAELDEWLPMKFQANCKSNMNASMSLNTHTLILLQTQQKSVSHPSRKDAETIPRTTPHEPHLRERFHGISTMVSISAGILVYNTPSLCYLSSTFSLISHIASSLSFSLLLFFPQLNLAMLEHEFAHQSYGLNGNDDKATAMHVEDISRPKMEAPDLVRAMTPEQRAIAEQKLKRKLDIRLLPMLILMHVLPSSLQYPNSG